MNLLLFIEVSDFAEQNKTIGNVLIRDAEQIFVLDTELDDRILHCALLARQWSEKMEKSEFKIGMPCSIGQNLHRKLFIEKWESGLALRIRLVFGGRAEFVFGQQIDSHKWITRAVAGHRQ